MKIMLCGKNYIERQDRIQDISLASIAREEGHFIVNSLRDKPDLVIFLDYDSRSTSTLNQARAMEIPTILIASEPSVVIPQHAQKRKLRKFDAVFKVGREKSQEFFRWPQKSTSPIVTSEKENRAVLVNADKWSFGAGHLYWLRSAISGCSVVDVYGTGWDSPLFNRLAHRSFEFFRFVKALQIPSFKGVNFLLGQPRNYMGIADDKIQTISRYKVAVVIENSLEVFTEKLFDAWAAGCIPVYVGPSFDSMNLPENLVVRPKELTVKSLESAIYFALDLDIGSFTRELNSKYPEIYQNGWHPRATFQRLLHASLDVKTSR